MVEFLRILNYIKNYVENNSLRLPAPEALQGRNKVVPYVFVEDSAFPLQNNIMKPYPGEYPKRSPRRIFNYRLSRARRIVENVFGITASVFRVLRKPMLLQPKTVETIVMAIAHLHNFLRNMDSSKNLYAPPDSLDSDQNGRLCEGSWRRDSEMLSLLPLNNVPRRAASTAKQIRDEFNDYFMNEGTVSWQMAYC